MDELKQTVRILVADVATLKTDVAVTRRDQANYQSRVIDWMTRTDRTLTNQDATMANQNSKLDAVLKNTNEWAGARKAGALLWAVLLGIATLVGAWASWLQAHAKMPIHWDP